MRLILLILISILLTSCGTVQYGMGSGSDESGVGSFGVENPDNLDVVYAKDVVIEPSYMIVGSSLPENMVETALTVEETPTIIIEEVENNHSTTSTNQGGNVVYKIPTEMTVRSTYQVIVRISKSKVRIYDNLNGAVKSSIITVTQTMEVNLIDSSPSDNKMFDIVPNNKGVQLVEDNEEVTQWTWDITPVRSGTSKLKVVISIIRDGVAKETVYEDTVVVRADVTKTVPFFISKYWQWIFSTLIIPIIIWYYKRKKKKDEEKKDENIN